MDDLISRQRMKDMITNHWSDFSNAANYRTALACVDAVPTINPGPKRGKWLPDNNNYIYEQYVCSECKNSFKVDTCMGKPMWNFCPYCGAKMER